MRVQIVYESHFGDARAIAEAIAEGLGPQARVTLVNAREAPPALEPGLDLLVCGGPTHGANLSTPESRRQAAAMSGHQGASGDPGLREWLAGLPQPSRPVLAAAYATRMAGPWILRLFAPVAGKVEARLRGRGFTILAPAESFYVRSGRGPLRPGEEERARRWGARLAERAAATARPPVVA